MRVLCSGGLSQLLNTIRLVQRALNPSLSIEGVLLTMFDQRLNLSNQVARDAREYFGSKVFRTAIPRNVRLAEAPSFGEPIIHYDVLSKGAQSYLALAKELLQEEARVVREAETDPATTGGRGMNRGKKERLGRGLEALLGDFGEDRGTPEAAEVRMLPVKGIRPNPFQPRKEFASEELEELAKSIQDNGLLQPLVVRPGPGEGVEWELVAGERRLRAVTQLGWSEVPAWVREVDDQTLLVFALVENLQRESLGALEEAEGYRVLSESFGLTQGEIAQAVGKDRSTVANTLRLLQLTSVGPEASGQRGPFSWPRAPLAGFGRSGESR